MDIIINIKTTLVFRKCWGASVLGSLEKLSCICSHTCKLDFIVLAYEDKNLRLSQTFVSYAKHRYKKELKTGMPYFSLALLLIKIIWESGSNMKKKLHGLNIST